LKASCLLRTSSGPEHLLRSITPTAWVKRITTSVSAARHFLLRNDPAEAVRNRNSATERAELRTAKDRGVRHESMPFNRGQSAPGLGISRGLVTRLPGCSPAAVSLSLPWTVQPAMRPGNRRQYSDVAKLEAIREAFDRGGFSVKTYVQITARAYGAAFEQAKSGSRTHGFRRTERCHMWTS
jgi:hypothetical protein